MSADEEYTRFLNYDEGRPVEATPFFERMRAKLLHELAEMQAGGRRRPTVERSADEVEQAICRAENETVAAMLSSDRLIIRSILAAIRAIESMDGTYGVCEDCEEKIPEKRMDAVPWAPRCAPCQDKKERREKEMAEAGVFAGDEE